MLEVKNLKTRFYTEAGTIAAVNDISFSLNKGQTLGLVGESGCGKSVTALSIMRLIDENQGKIEAGSIHFQNMDLLTLSEREMRKIRGNKISMIFQEPMTSLNPVFTVGNQISEVLRVHKSLSKKEAKEHALELLRIVRISDPLKRYNNYPHQLSGGMLQRIMIAMAISCEPLILIADEPTTALDVTIQAQILKVLADLKEKYKLALLLITHDLGIVAEVADRIAVMYAGMIVEEGDAIRLFNNPCHPYTSGLIESVPRIDTQYIAKGHLTTIQGTIPNPLALPQGCPFEPRCPHKMPVCSTSMPPEIGDEWQRIRCYLYSKAPLKSAIKLERADKG